MKAPSPYALAVVRALLSRPMTAPQLAAVTRLAERTVLAQIDALRKADAIRVRQRIGQGRRAGSFAQYEPVVFAL